MGTFHSNPLMELLSVPLSLQHLVDIMLGSGNATYMLPPNTYMYCWTLTLNTRNSNDPFLRPPSLYLSFPNRCRDLRNGPLSFPPSVVVSAPDQITLSLINGLCRSFKTHRLITDPLAPIAVTPHFPLLRDLSSRISPLVAALYNSVFSVGHFLGGNFNLTKELRLDDENIGTIFGTAK